MDNTRSIRNSIDILLEDLWDSGYEIGKADQLNDDDVKLETEMANSYDSGFDSGFDEGYRKGLADGKKEVSE